jgi:hypothetical protein
MSPFPGDYLDPTDWFLAPWRQLPPLPRTPVRPFDLRACANQLSRVPRSGRGHDWSELGLSPALAPQEARFWFEAMTRVGPDVAPRELALYLQRQPLDRLLARNEITARLRRRANNVPPEVVAPLVVLLSPEDVLDFIAGDDLKETPPGWRVPRLNSHVAAALCAGFRRHLVPYLTADEASRLREAVRERLPPQLAKVSPWQLPPAVYAAAGLGLHAEMEELLGGWTDGRPDAPDLPCLVFGLDGPGKVRRELRRLGGLLTTPEHVRGWLAHTELADLEMVQDSILSCTAKAEARALLEVLYRVQAPEVAPLMLHLKRSSKAPELADRWLREQPASAALGLVPLASGCGKLAEAALGYLRDSKQAGYGAVVEDRLRQAGAVAPRVRRAVLEEVPGPEVFTEETSPEWLRLLVAVEREAKRRRLPAWASPEQLPLIRIGERCLAPEQVSAVLLALRGSTLQRPMRLVRELKKHAERSSLDAFAWGLCERWLGAGAPPREKWAFLAAGLLGSDATALQLGPLVRAWPGQGLSRRAQLGLEVLRAIGSESALLQLAVMARKGRFKALENTARGFMMAIAAERGLTAEQLEDRTVPDLGLGERGTRVLDFGPRRFTVALGPNLGPVLRDEAGRVRSEVPRPAAKDDPTRAAESVREWKLLRKQLRETVRAQVKRLQSALATGRRWSAGEFENYLLRHPLMTHLARRLVWGSFDDRGKLLRVFRVSQQSECLDGDDQPITPAGLVGLVHPLHLNEEQRGRWSRVLADHDIVPPFPQLGMTIRRLEPGEETALVLRRFEEAAVPAVALLGILDRLGWDRGAAGPHGRVCRHLKRFHQAGLTAVLAYQPGVWGGYRVNTDEQRLAGCFFVRPLVEPPGGFAVQDAVPLGKVGPIVINEVLGAMAAIGSRGG